MVAKKRTMTVAKKRRTMMLLLPKLKTIMALTGLL